MLYPTQSGSLNEVRIIAEEEDGSPSIPKHYFVWNPPLLNVDGVTPLPLVVPTMTNSSMYRGKHFKRNRNRCGRLKKNTIYYNIILHCT